MKKLVRIKMISRRGICGEEKECEYVVNKKFCENMNIDFSYNKEEIVNSLKKKGLIVW